jgi:parallel beta-helix repeat protein
MMKKLLFAAFALMAFSANAQYTTPNSNLNWGLDDLIINAPAGVISLSDGVYILSQNLTIAVSDTLTINENTTFYIDPDVEITIAGTMIADADAILITSTADAQPFGTIRFEENSTGYLHNVTIDFGKGIRVATGDFEMQNCSMSYHQAGTTTSAALTFSTGSPLINASNFTNNMIPAFGSGANIESAPTFSNNYLENKHPTNSNRPQINMGPSGNDTIRIVNNIIKGNPLLTLVGGISASSLLGNMNKVIIDGNTITDNRYGITVAGANSSGYIRNNIIEDNDTQNNPALGGSGISLNASGAATMNIIASGNQIRRNLWGITLIGQARINLGSDDEATFNAGGNVFAQNGNGGNTYALFNNTPNPVQAINNCWIEGTSPTAADVENVINHQVDDNALGLVTFTPFTDCLLGTVASENVFSSIYPNPNSGRFTIAVSQNASAEIYNISGQLLFLKDLVSGENMIDFDVPAGIYLVKMISDSGTATKKIIKK